MSIKRMIEDLESLIQLEQEFKRIKQGIAKYTSEDTSDTTSEPGTPSLTNHEQQQDVPAPSTDTTPSSAPQSTTPTIMTTLADYRKKNPQLPWGPESNNLIALGRKLATEFKTQCGQLSKKPTTLTAFQNIYPQDFLDAHVPKLLA